MTNSRRLFASSPGLRPLTWSIAVMLFVLAPGRVLADITGKQDFEQNCASCHGADGKGHGEATNSIPGINPPDLTKLSQGNGGIFPEQRVLDSIDGRGHVPSHSRFSMPFWGTEFQILGKEFTPESDAQVNARLRNIVAFIKTIQEK